MADPREDETGGTIGTQARLVVVVDAQHDLGHLRGDLGNQGVEQPCRTRGSADPPALPFRSDVVGAQQHRTFRVLGQVTEDSEPVEDPKSHTGLQRGDTIVHLDVGEDDREGRTVRVGVGARQRMHRLGDEAALPRGDPVAKRRPT